MTPQELLSLKLPLFAGLREKDLAGIELVGSQQRLQAGQKVIEQDEDSQNVHFLLAGALLAVLWTDQGREIVYSRFKLGAYFGELAAFDGAARSLTVIARTDATVLALRRASFLQLFENIPLVRQRVTRDLVARIRTLTARNMEMTTLSVEDRVRMFILRLAMEQGNLSKGAFIQNTPTHAEIAGSVGANREMVSRSLSKFTKQGMIRASRQRIEILDPDALMKTNR